MHGAPHFFSAAGASRWTVASNTIRNRWQNRWDWWAEQRGHSNSISKYRETLISKSLSRGPSEDELEWNLTMSSATHSVVYSTYVPCSMQNLDIYPLWFFITHLAAEEHSPLAAHCGHIKRTTLPFLSLSLEAENIDSGHPWTLLIMGD